MNNSTYDLRKNDDLFRFVLAGYKPILRINEGCFFYWETTIASFSSQFDCFFSLPIKKLKSLRKIHDKLFVLAYSVGESLVGLAVFNKVDSRSLELLTFEISPIYRRLGHAKYFINTAFPLLMVKGIHNIYTRNRTQFKAHNGWSELLGDGNWSVVKTPYSYFDSSLVNLREQEQVMKNYARLSSVFSLISLGEASNLSWFKGCLSSFSMEQVNVYLRPEVVAKNHNISINHSYAVKDKLDHLVGWILCSHDNTTCVVLSFFCLPKYTATGIAVKVASLFLINSSRDGCSISFMVRSEDTIMKKLANKLFVKRFGFVVENQSYYNLLVNK